MQTNTLPTSPDEFDPYDDPDYWFNKPSLFERIAKLEADLAALREQVRKATHRDEQ